MPQNQAFQEIHLYYTIKDQEVHQHFVESISKYSKKACPFRPFRISENRNLNGSDFSGYLQQDYFANFIIISLLRFTNSVISSGLSGLCASIARSYN